MKPVYLEFCGLNSFSEKAQIDFKKLLSGGVFGIFGDTGSGKSTILDSIHFALYGEIDRAPKSFGDCINYRMDFAYVLFDFEITTDGVRHTYRVKRERRRKSGSTKANLFEREDSGELLVLAEGARDVDEKIEEIIGLSFADFKMCIALPQGDFAALVKSTQSERVKLVARLFNLEKYGERFFKAANEKYYEAEKQVNLIKAKMDENDGGNDELIERTGAELAADKETLAQTSIRLAAVKEAYQTAYAVEKEKRAFDTLCATLKRLQSQLPVWQEKRIMLEKLPKAKGVEQRATALENIRKQKAAAFAAAQLAKQNHTQSVAKLEQAKQTLLDGKFDEQILALSMQIQKVQESAADVERANKAKAEMDACIAQYTALKNNCPFEEFAQKREQLEREIQALGEDTNLLDYLKHRYKDVLLVDAYGEFRADLREIEREFPQTKTAIATLLQKYTPKTGTQETLDVAAIQLSFKETERKRKALQAELDALEKRRRAYDENEHNKKLITEKGKVLREHYNLAMEKIAAVKDLGTEQQLSARLEKVRKAQRDANLAVEKEQAAVGNYFAEAQKQDGLYTLHSQAEEEGLRALAACLQESGFDNEKQAVALIENIGDEERAQRETQRFFEEYEHLRRTYEDTDKAKFENYDENAFANANRILQETEREKDVCLGNIAAKENALKRLLDLREKYREQANELVEKERCLQLCDQLRQLLRGNRFLEFIASEYLQEICVTASKTLLSLTGGRYFLQYDKDFKVGDNLDGGNLRAVKTLSGGETFLVSLSLALSLSGAICMKSLRPIEFFFLDEGFGTLDEKLVETVMDVLGKLSKTFAVGLISHVEELKHRIDNKILVTGATETHGSVVRVETF